MNITEFVKNFKNYPILFVGAGFSRRYLKVSFSWEELLKKIMLDLDGNVEKYLDFKSECSFEKNINWALLSEKIEEYFNRSLQSDRYGKFKEINDQFYNLASKNIFASKFKLYIAKLLSSNEINLEKQSEIEELKLCSRNIATIISTNYDLFIENTLHFNPLIGNNILFNNPYGAVYKIHGCISAPEDIIITKKDYELFEKRYELIQAQLISMFISNPIIFVGYSVNDPNIKNILNTIFSYVDPNSDEAEKIRNNFLLVDYCKNSQSTEVMEHDIVINQTCVIKINKIKTDNFNEIYKAISDLALPISAMDIRKVQNIVREITRVNGAIKVHVDFDIDSLENQAKILYLGNKKVIQYEYQPPAHFLKNYFQLIDNPNLELISLVNKLPLKSNKYFPYFRFSKLVKIDNTSSHLEDQYKKITFEISQIEASRKNFICKSIKDIECDSNIAKTFKPKVVYYNAFKGNISLNELRNYITGLNHSTEYNKLICLWDYLSYQQLQNKTEE